MNENALKILSSIPHVRESMFSIFHRFDTLIKLASFLSSDSHCFSSFILLIHPFWLVLLSISPWTLFWLATIRVTVRGLKIADWGVRISRHIFQIYFVHILITFLFAITNEINAFCVFCYFFFIVKQAYKPRSYASPKLCRSTEWPI